MPSNTPPPKPRRLAPIEYALPQDRPTLPGFLVTIGVVSICLGLLGALTNSVALIRSRTYYAMAIGKVPTGPAAPRPSSLPPCTGDLFAATGFGRAQRDAIITSIQEPSFSADRKVMLARLLGEFGQTIFPGATPHTVTPDRVSHLPAGPDGIHLMGSTVIRLDTGILWIDDAAARFHRTNDDTEFKVEHDRVTDNVGRVTRSTVCVAEQLEQLHTQLGSGFNTTQAAVLASDLLSATPNFTPGKPFTDVMTNPSGATVFDPMISPHLIGTTLEYGRSPSVYLLANGAKVVNTGNIDPATGLTQLPAGVSRAFPYTPGMVIASGIDAALSIAIGLLLAISGLLMLCRYSQAASWHVRLAWLKLVETAYWLGVSIFTLSHLLDQMQNAAPGRREGLVIGMVGVILLQFIYPIVLLFVLRSPTSRAYFSSRSAGVHVLPDSIRQALGPQVEAMLGSPAGFSAGGGLAIVGLVLAGVQGWFALKVNPTEPTLPLDSVAWHGLTALAILLISVATIVVLILALLNSRRRARGTPGAVYIALLLLAWILTGSKVCNAQDAPQSAPPASQPASQPARSEAAQHLVDLLHDYHGPNGPKLYKARRELMNVINADEMSLFDLLSDPDPAVRRDDLFFLENMGPRHPQQSQAAYIRAIPYLVEEVKSTDPERMRANAAYRLG